MTIRWGVSPIAWANDDMPELGGATPLDAILADIEAIGFEGVELGGKFPREPEALKAALAPYRLEIIGGWYSASLLLQDANAEIAALAGHAALLQAMGADVFVIAETSNAIHGDRAVPLADTPRLTDAEWVVFGERLDRVADHLNARGMRLAYHHHMGTVVETAADLDRFLAHTGPAVGLVLDTGHAALGGIDSVAVIERHPERIVHVHCKDVRWDVYARVQRERLSFMDGVLAGMYTVPGDGGLDFVAVMRALKGIGYSGWIVQEAEQDPAIADPHDYSTLGLQTLRREAAAAGLA